MFDRYLRSSVYSIHDDISEKKFPGFRKTIWLECIQEQNEIVFVPSGWYHQVHNLEDTISINHNWFNAYNLSWVWNLLLRDYNVAKEYIEDIRDICDNFEGLCQRNLAANTGMNFYDFMIFITRFTLSNIVQLFHLRHEEGSLTSLVTRSNLFITNLISVRSVATKMKFAEAFTEENINSRSEENLIAFSDIQKIIHEREFQDLSSALRMAYECINNKLKEEGSQTERTQDCFPYSTFFDFITSLGSKIQSPEDLVGLIDRVLEKTDSSNCNIIFSCDAEPFVV